MGHPLQRVIHDDRQVIGGSADIAIIALAGRFLPKFLKSHDWMPAGTMSVLSVIGIIVTLFAFAKK